jgi:hypothetical protein
MVNVVVFFLFQIKMSVGISGLSEPAPYDDEEIQLMDTDETNLELDEQLINTNTNVGEKNNDEKQIEKEEVKIPSLLVIEVCFIEK